MHKLMKLLVLTVCVSFLFLIPAPAQDKNNDCQTLRLLLQADLNFFRPFPGIGWSGTVRGFLDAAPVRGTLFYMPPDRPKDTEQHGQTGHEYNSRAVFDLGSDGSFVTDYTNAVFQTTPLVSPHFYYPPIGENVWGHYSATAKIVPDLKTYDIGDPWYDPASEFVPTTGRFVNATGNISINGIFIGDSPDPSDAGIWNAEITGKLCKVAPKP